MSLAPKPTAPQVAYDPRMDAKSKRLYAFVIEKCVEEYAKMLGPKAFSPAIKINLIVERQTSEGKLAEANMEGFKATVTNNPGFELSGLAGMLAHEFAHVLATRLLQSTEPQQYYRLGWNLVHFAVYEKAGGKSYRYAKRYRIGKRTIIITYIDVKALVATRAGIKCPAADGRYFV